MNSVLLATGAILTSVSNFFTVRNSSRFVPVAASMSFGLKKISNFLCIGGDNFLFHTSLTLQCDIQLVVYFQSHHQSG
jgi:hypothetical protein